MTPPRRICFISHLPWKGGAERGLLETIDALRERGVECCVIVPFPGPLIADLRRRAVPTAVIPFGWWVGRGLQPGMRVLQTFALVLAVIPVTLRIKTWRCDAVYTNTICTCVGAIAARLLRIPHVWHIHEFGFEDHGLRFYFGERFSACSMERLSNLCIANSQAVARKFSRYISPPKLTVIYQSVTLTKTDPPEPARTLFATAAPGLMCIMVGRLHERKGHADAIRAIGELRRECSALLLIVGNGDARYVRRLRGLIREYDLEDRVRFVGYDEDPARRIAGADVLLVCSKAEAFGRTTVEAMILGKPVIGARSGGTPELIQDGATGFLYTPGDYRELGERILSLEKHPERRRAMGEAARIWAAERFTKRVYGEALLRALGGCAT